MADEELRQFQEQLERLKQQAASKQSQPAPQQQQPQFPQGGFGAPPPPPPGFPGGPVSYLPPPPSLPPPPPGFPGGMNFAAPASFSAPPLPSRAPEPSFGVGNPAAMPILPIPEQGAEALKKEALRAKGAPVLPAAPSTVSSTGTSAPAEDVKAPVISRGGQVWEDKTLLEWPENDFRFFVGDLSNEVTDKTLAEAFRRYPSFAKARVVRDPETSKSKGYGFVSLTDPQDFLKAWKEMDGKYVGPRPIRLKKADWRKNAIETTEKVRITRKKSLKPARNRVRKPVL